MTHPLDRHPSVPHNTLLNVSSLLIWSFENGSLRWGGIWILQSGITERRTVAEGFGLDYRHPEVQPWRLWCMVSSQKNHRSSLNSIMERDWVLEWGRHLLGEKLPNLASQKVHYGDLSAKLLARIRIPLWSVWVRREELSRLELQALARWEIPTLRRGGMGSGQWRAAGLGD